MLFILCGPLREWQQYMLYIDKNVPKILDAKIVPVISPLKQRAVGCFVFYINVLIWKSKNFLVQEKNNMISL